MDNDVMMEPFFFLRAPKESGRPDSGMRKWQGLTLVHFSAQPQPFWSHLPVSPAYVSPCEIDWGKS